MVIDDRLKILADIETKENAVYSKKKQIRSAKKRINFRGVRINDQFREGRQGVKPFRKKRKLERKQGFVDLGIFSNDMLGLSASLVNSKKALFDFDNPVGVL